MECTPPFASGSKGLPAAPLKAIYCHPRKPVPCDRRPSMWHLRDLWPRNHFPYLFPCYARNGRPRTYVSLGHWGSFVRAVSHNQQRSFRGRIGNRWTLTLLCGPSVAVLGHGVYWASITMRCEGRWQVSRKWEVRKVQTKKLMMINDKITSCFVLLRQQTNCNMGIPQEFPHSKVKTRVKRFGSKTPFSSFSRLMLKYTEQAFDYFGVWPFPTRD